jgi:hypothetical protein
VFKSGKVLLTTQSCRALKKVLAKRSIIHWEVVTHEFARYRIIERYDAILRRAHYDRGIPTRTCLQCRYGAISNSGSTPMVCFKQRGRTLPTGVNKATDCLEYSPIPTYEELMSVRQLQLQGRPPSLDDPDDESLIED